MPNIGPTELIIVLVIALVVLGPEAAAAGRPLARPGDARVQGLADGLGRAHRRRAQGRRARLDDRATRARRRAGGRSPAARRRARRARAAAARPRPGRRSRSRRARAAPRQVEVAVAEHQLTRRRCGACPWRARARAGAAPRRTLRLDRPRLDGGAMAEVEREPETRTGRRAAATSMSKSSRRSTSIPPSGSSADHHPAALARSRAGARCASISSVQALTGSSPGGAAPERKRHDRRVHGAGDVDRPPQQLDAAAGGPRRAGSGGQLARGRAGTASPSRPRGASPSSSSSAPSRSARARSRGASGSKWTWSSVSATPS